MAPPLLCFAGYPASLHPDSQGYFKENATFRLYLCSDSLKALPPTSMFSTRGAQRHAAVRTGTPISNTSGAYSCAHGSLLSVAWSPNDPRPEQAKVFAHQIYTQNGLCLINNDSMLPLCLESYSVLRSRDTGSRRSSSARLASALSLSNANMALMAVAA